LTSLYLGKNNKLPICVNNMFCFLSGTKEGLQICLLESTTNTRSLFRLILQITVAVYSYWWPDFGGGGRKTRLSPITAIKKKVDFGVNDFHSEEFSLGVVAFHLV